MRTTNGKGVCLASIRGSRARMVRTTLQPVERKAAASAPERRVEVTSHFCGDASDPGRFLRDGEMRLQRHMV